ncbi:MAG: replication-associated recombination protein A [SAR202 cluster bacterium]|jgi:putative ATPase|nr:replication-associated recombination protein A [SAR202 cluster bacterium]MDP6302555.1 replication-associated recombination protein A [SAR202 cluster bacterium]MDP7103808.1 replication-associated recombination protein A [SAR202 cluster bacterium]MDP7225322.1 replication-associated recombination protein A [SAR202 cluster bacterium]MDP7413543.1 replication-associated recombination protein A [SAR202 cluster bacterium]|tara:strand:+ start:5725 stop:7074 length:1350 start_codon:yes stop_codon:yes gene_type:complete
MTLFEHEAAQKKEKLAPLAARMRPRTFDEYVGQDHIVGSNTTLRRALNAGHVPSMILWGPPGTGKTTLATLLATMTSSYFERISAVGSGVADLRRVMSEASDRLGMHGQRSILFVDEIHRFNKAQQDVILPQVEDGTIVLIGATTENPSFEVVSPLLSRSTVYALTPLAPEEVEQVVHAALNDSNRGLGTLDVTLDEDAFEVLVNLSNGDARTALNGLELAVLSAPMSSSGGRIVDRETAHDAMQRRVARYDKSGDMHYDTISAFIKSVRSSDPNAAVYWLARMIEAGEDPLFIARRIVVLAAEDIGMADPQALSVAVAAQQAVHFIGMPEGRIPLAEATVYLATAPKSNAAYMAIGGALEDARNTRNDPVPLHLRNAVTGMMRDLGYGKDYKYTHDFEGHFTPTDNLPENLKDRKYYEPTDQGYEAEVAKRLSRWWGALASLSDQDES